MSVVDRGINVSFGQDCVCDTFYPFGRDDPLELAFFMAHAAHRGMPAQIEAVFSMPTVAGAKVLRLERYGLNPGDSANAVIIDARSTKEAIRFQPLRRWVIRNGQIFAGTILSRKIFFKIRDQAKPSTGDTQPASV
jgi:cytosine/creatinine deaminase